jgi:WhiB family redox-sensing transcriptional regulator
MSRQGVSWQDDALCATADPELWFPGNGGPSVAAKRICRQCPVRPQCLHYALRHGEEYGIWGGLSYSQRQELTIAEAA